MDGIEQRIARVLPMEPMEKALKYIWGSGQELSAADLYSPDILQFFQDENQVDQMNFPERIAIFGSHQGFVNIAGYLPENVTLSGIPFFQPQRNISIMRHPRYMPEISHNHSDFFEIQCMLNGSLSQTIGDIPVTLRPGDLCFIAPHSTHCPRVMDDDTVLINILVRIETLRNAFSSSLSDKDIISEFFMRILYGKTYQPMLLCHTNKEPRVFSLIMDMIEEANSDGPYTDKLLCTMLELLFIYLLRDHKDNFTIGRPLRKTDDSIIKIMRFAQKHYAEITLSDLAKQFNYSESYLSSLIRSYYGRTFQEMMADLRLQNAARLLTESSATISEIVDEIGYSEKSHFFHAFKKKYGVTPSIYRKHNRSESL